MCAAPQRSMGMAKKSKKSSGLFSSNAQSSGPSKMSVMGNFMSRMKEKIQKPKSEAMEECDAAPRKMMGKKAKGAAPRMNMMESKNTFAAP